MTGNAIADAVLSGDRRAAAQLITRIESGDGDIRETLEILYGRGGGTRAIGITGPPGAGKSTVVDGLIAHWRSAGGTVAVLAVDPSSPINGGAVLGDRVRMGRHAGDPGVLIRSMAARGALGGLADACGDALTVLDALGFDHIVLETVGVGQSEVDILSHAECVVVLQTPEGGDGIQSVKAGVLEIGDIFVVNQADLGGADRMIRHLRTMVAHRLVTLAGWDAPILAIEANRSTGIDVLAKAIADFLTAVDAAPTAERQMRVVRQATSRVTALARNLMRRYLDEAQADAAFCSSIDATVARRLDPHAAARALIARAAACSNAP